MSLSPFTFLIGGSASASYSSIPLLGMRWVKISIVYFSTDGRRVVYLYSLPFFMVGSIGVSSATGIPILLFWRILQAVGVTSTVSACIAIWLPHMSWKGSPSTWYVRNIFSRMRISVCQALVFTARFSWKICLFRGKKKKKKKKNIRESSHLHQALKFFTHPSFFEIFLDPLALIVFEWLGQRRWKHYWES